MIGKHLSNQLMIGKLFSQKLMKEKHLSNQMVIEKHPSNQMKIGKHLSNQLMIGKLFSHQLMKEKHLSNQMVIGKHPSNQKKIGKHLSNQLMIGITYPTNWSKGALLAFLGQKSHCFRELCFTEGLEEAVAPLSTCRFSKKVLNPAHPTPTCWSTVLTKGCLHRRSMETESKAKCRRFGLGARSNATLEIFGVIV